DRWMPVSPVTGRLDAFEWKEPLAQLGGAGALIGEGYAPSAIEEPVRQRATSERTRSADDQDAGIAPMLSNISPRISRPEAAPRMAPGAQSVDQVIPLVHLPDDPGPESAAEPETQAAADRSTNGWSRLRRLFR